MAEDMDAVDILTRDHRNVEDLFGRYEAATDPDTKTEIVHEVVHELAVHGEIEELRFYPRLREVLEDGDALADEAVNEHVEMKQTLDDLDSMTAEDEGFDQRMHQLMGEVRHHVEEEERDLFPGIRQALSDDELQDLGQRLEQARSLVPTRPHPNAPTSPEAKAAAGPPTALMDRVRDAIRNVTD